MAPSWRVSPLFAVALAVMAMLVAAATSFWVGSITADHRAFETTINTKVSELDQLAREAKKTGEAANAELERRGEEPVPIPDPDGATDTQVIVQSATAEATRRVLEAIPVPKNGKDGKDGRDGESPVCMAEPAGCRGEDGVDGQDGVNGQAPACLSEPNQCRGEDGHTPTTEEIRAVIAEMVAGDPDSVLCPLGGHYQQITVLRAGPPPEQDDIWTCT